MIKQFWQKKLNYNLRKKLATPLYIVPRIPKDIASWFKVSKTLITFAKANGVEIKDEKELSKLDAFNDPS